MQGSGALAALLLLREGHQKPLHTATAINLLTVLHNCGKNQNRLQPRENGK